MSIRTILVGLLVVFFVTGCRMASNQVASDGKYYRNVGGNSCAQYDVVRSGRIKCMDVDGKFTYYQNAMTDQEVMVWKMDDIGSAIKMNSYQPKTTIYRPIIFKPVPITFGY